MKLYVSEARSVEVQRWVRSADAVATSIVAYAESRAAFARSLREGSTTAPQHQSRIGRFNQDWAVMMRIELQAAIARNAGELAEVHALRGFDAIHLASALWLRDKSEQAFTFAVFDVRLRDAATLAGLTVFG